MVAWNKNTELDGKAKHLEEVDSYECPDFFTLSPEEVEIILSQDPKQEDPDLKQNFRDLGVDRDVRNASPRAKNLVQNQRSSHKAVVRTCDRSADSKPVFNVSEQNILQSVRNCFTSRPDSKTDLPGVIVQKMVDADFTFHLHNGFSRGRSLIEYVEGLGVSMEKNITRPTFVIRDEEGEQFEEYAPDRREIMVKSRGGSIERREVEPAEISQDLKEKVIEVSERIDQEGYSGKLVSNRGNIYLVDLLPKEEAPSKVASKMPLNLGYPAEQSKPASLKRNSSNCETRKNLSYDSNASKKAREKKEQLYIIYEKNLQSTGETSTPESSAYIPEPVHDVEVVGENYGPANLTEVTPENLLRTHQRAFLNLNRFQKKQRAIETLDADYKAVLLASEDAKIIRSVISEQFDKIIVESEKTKRAIEKQERKYVLDKLRELD